MTEAEIKSIVQNAYRQGALDERAINAKDLRALADDFCEQIFQLRQEVRKALGLPKLVSPDDYDATLQ